MGALTQPSRLATWSPLILAGCVLAAYVNSFEGAFVFDDVRTIVENPALQQGWQLSRDGSPTTGRPLVHLSLALNHALHGLNVTGYHVFNVGVHLLAAFVLWGCVRRTFRLSPRLASYRADADRIALMVAALWAVHPLQTSAVTYVVQRAEVLCGLFYLLTFYALLRGAEPALAGGARPAATRRTGWYTVAVVAAFAGAGSKEVIVTAPLLALLFDRTFLAGSWREAVRLRWPLYAGLFSTWQLVGWLALESGSRGGSAGFAAGVPWWQYAWTQFPAVLQYVRLAFWPEPLVFDYGREVVTRFSEVWLPALIVGGAMILTVWALWRRPAAGFLGAWLFLILAPSSSVVPIVTQTMAEHRVYLPLIAIVSGVVVLLHAKGGRVGHAVLAGVILINVGLTLRRNADYATPVALWSDTVRKVPMNARAHYNRGIALAAAGQAEASRESFATAVAVRSEYPQAWDALGSALLAEGRTAEAITAWETAVRLQPNFVNARINLGGAWQQAGRDDAALAEYAAALEIEPDAFDAHFNRAGLLARRGELAGAIHQYRAALRTRPDFVDARYGLANALARDGRLAEARVIYEALVRERPADTRARTNLGNVHLLLGQLTEAMAAYEMALRIDPGDEAARSYLEQTRALQRTGGGGR